MAKSRDDYRQLLDEFKDLLHQLEPERSMPLLLDAEDLKTPKKLNVMQTAVQQGSAMLVLHCSAASLRKLHAVLQQAGHKPLALFMDEADGILNHSPQQLKELDSSNEEQDSEQTQREQELYSMFEKLRGLMTVVQV